MLKGEVMLLTSPRKSTIVTEVNRVYRRNVDQLIQHLWAGYCTHEKTQYAHWTLRCISVWGYSLPDHLTQLIHIFKQHIVVSHGPTGTGDSILLISGEIRPNLGLYLWMKSAAAALFRSALRSEINIRWRSRRFSIHRFNHFQVQMIIPKNANDGNWLTS